MKFSSLAVLVLALPTASAFSPSFISTERLMRKEQKLEEIAAATAAVEVKRKALEEELAYINFEKSSLEKEAKKMEYGNPVLSAASGAVATTAALCTLFAASNALAPKYVNEHLTKTGSNPSEIIIPKKVVAPKVEQKKPQQASALKVEQKKSAPSPALKVEEKKPVPVPMPKVEVKKPEPVPVLKVEQKKPEPALEVEGKKPEPAPALKVEQKKPSPAPVQKVEAKKLDTSPALKVQQKKTEPASTTVVPFDFDDNMKVAIAGAAALALVGIAGASAISDNIGTVKSKQKTGYTNGADNGSYFDNMSEPAAVKPKQEVAFNKLSYPVQSTLPPRPPARSSFDNVSATANVKREQRTGNTNGAGNESYFDRMSAPAAMKPEQEESSIKSGIGSFFNNMSAPFRSNSPSPQSFGASSTPANAGSMNGAGNGSYLKPKQNVAFNNISNSISPRPPPPANEADNGSYFDRMSAPAAVKPKQNVAFNNISFSQQPRPPVGASFDNISAVANVKRNQRTTNANGAGNESYFDNMSAPATVKPKQQVAFNNISTSQQPPPPAVSTSAPEPISEPILDPRQASTTESYFDNVSAAANVKPKTKIGSTNRDKIRSYFDRMSAPAAVKPKQKEASIATGITSFFNNISGPVQSTPEPIWETMPVPEPVPESPRSYLNVISAPANNWNDDVSSKSNIYD